MISKCLIVSLPSHCFMISDNFLPEYHELLSIIEKIVILIKSKLDFQIFYIFSNNIVHKNMID